MPSFDRPQKIAEGNEIFDDEIMDDGDVDIIEQRLNVNPPFLLGDLSSQTSQQGRFVDAHGHRRVDCRNRGDEAVRRAFWHIPPPFGWIIGRVLYCPNPNLGHPLENARISERPSSIWGHSPKASTRRPLQH